MRASISTLLSRASKIAVNSLEIQLQTSTKVVELTRTIGTMAEITKEATKMAAQVADVLEVAKTFQDDVNVIYGFAGDIRLLTTKAQGTCFLVYCSFKIDELS